MHYAIVAAGLLSSVCGLALLVRFGFRYRSRIEFGGTMPVADQVDPEVIQRHNNDVKGRFGFALVVIGILLLTFASSCPFAQA